MRALLAFVIAVANAPALASPPPQPPREVGAIGWAITTGFNLRNLELYGRDLADDIVVMFDDTVVAKSKAEWLRQVKEQFKFGMRMRLIERAGGSDRSAFLVMMSQDCVQPSTCEAIPVPVVFIADFKGDKVSQLRMFGKMSYLYAEEGRIIG